MIDRITRRRRVTAMVAAMIFQAWVAGDMALAGDPTVRALAAFTFALVAGWVGFIAGRESNAD